MNSIDFAELSLQRYPSKHAKELRAWDAADEYLVQFLSPNMQILLINDAFGALHRASEIAGAQSIFHLNDSWCSRAAIDTNQREMPFAEFTGQEIEIALLKLPKSVSLLQAQLESLAAQINKPIVLYIAGMQKHVSAGHLDVIKALSDEVEYLPTVKKARMYRATMTPFATKTQFQQIEFKELGLVLINAPGVFAEDKIDIGSRFFIEHFKQLPQAATVTDVGCGNGLLALAYQQIHPEAQLFLFDESLAAVNSARLSFARNAPQATVHIQHHDGLADITEKFDLILINPPFHQQNTVTTDIALSMFDQAKQCLSSKGELWIVANRHLDYWQALRKRFKQVDSMAQNAKFVILRAKMS